MAINCLFDQQSGLQLHSATESASSHGLLSAVIDEKSAYLFRQWLKSNNFEDSQRKSRKILPSSVAIPVNYDFLSRVLHLTSTNGFYAFNGFHFELRDIDLPLKSSKRSTNGVALLVKDLSRLNHPKFSWNESLERDLPSSWERHGDLVLLPEHCFLRDEWMDLGVDLWKLVASAFRCFRIAKRGRITNNSFRSPAVTLLHGSTGWVEHVDNKIRYRYDVTKCMFSAGNITEKLRVAGFNCEGEIVVDLFAGIGYFTLPYLVHAHASLVYACEWNPDAVEALKTNLALNGVAERCIVLEGDNRQSCPKGVANRVNLGLIPSSEGSWDVACAALNPERGGILHIHGNVTSQTTQSTTKPNACHQTPTLDTANRINITSESRDNKEIPDASRHEVSELGVGKSPVIIDDRNSRDATCGESNSKVNEQSEEINTCHPAANKTALEGSLRTFNLLSDKTGHDLSYNETDIEPANRICGPAFPAVNHRLPANQICSCDAQNEGHSTRKQGEQKCHKSVKMEWVDWSSRVCQKLEEMLRLQTSKQWQATVIHIEHVKSYAPHIDHIVADICCAPCNREESNES